MKNKIEIERYLGLLSGEMEELKQQQDKILSIFDEATKNNVFDLNKCYESHQILENIMFQQEYDEQFLNKLVERKKVEEIETNKKVSFGVIKDHSVGFFSWLKGHFKDIFDFIKDCISSLDDFPETGIDGGEIFCIIIASFATAYNALSFFFGYRTGEYFNAAACLICGIVGMLCFIPTIVKFFKWEGNWFGFIYSFFELAILIGDIVWFCTLFNS